MIDDPPPRRAAQALFELRSVPVATMSDLPAAATGADQPLAPVVAMTDFPDYELRYAPATFCLGQGAHSTIAHPAGII